MRRPLFGNGIPLNIPGQGAAVSNPVKVFDSTDFTPNANAPQVFVLTLYVWPWFNVGGTDTLPEVLNVILADNGDTPGTSTPLLASMSASYFNAIATASLKSAGEPVKVLDRYVLRGDQQVYVDNISDVTSTSCFVYGYFEVAGESAFSEPERPLQPAALAAPFEADPTVVTAALGVSVTNKYATAHQLSATYLDLLTLYVNTVLGDTGSEAVAVLLPNGTVMPMPELSFPGLPLQPFDGIPMRAPSSSDNLVQVGYISATGLAALSAYGRFRRY